MEIEALFLAETAHFPKIDPSITVEEIKKTLLFDPEDDDMSLRLRPADDLNACYAIAGQSYEKRNAKSTVDVLDYESIYVELGNRINYPGKLIATINTFLS